MAGIELQRNVIKFCCGSITITVTLADWSWDECYLPVLDGMEANIEVVILSNRQRVDKCI